MDKIPVLAYHGFNDKISGSKANKYNIAIDALARQMELLFDRNYRTLSLDLLVSGEKSPSDKIKEIVITFDDGHLSNFTRVLPVLEKYSYKAIFFVTTGLIGKESDFMDWKQVSELSRKGHDVQSHGHTHRFLNQLSSEQVRRELEQSRDLIYSQTASLDCIRTYN